MFVLCSWICGKIKAQYVVDLVPVLFTDGPSLQHIGPLFSAYPCLRQDNANYEKVYKMNWLS